MKMWTQCFTFHTGNVGGSYRKHSYVVVVVPLTTQHMVGRHNHVLVLALKATQKQTKNNLEGPFRNDIQTAGLSLEVAEVAAVDRLRWRRLATRCPLAVVCKL